MSTRERRFQVGPLTGPHTFKLMVDDVHGRAMVVDPNGFVIDSLPLVDPEATSMMPMPLRAVQQPQERPELPPQAVPTSPALEAVVDPSTGQITAPPGELVRPQAAQIGGLVVLLPIVADYRQHRGRGRAGWHLGSRAGDSRMAGGWTPER